MLNIYNYLLITEVASEKKDKVLKKPCSGQHMVITQL